MPTVLKTLRGWMMNQMKKNLTLITREVKYTNISLKLMKTTQNWSAITVKIDKPKSSLQQFILDSALFPDSTQFLTRLDWIFLTRLDWVILTRLECKKPIELKPWFEMFEECFDEIFLKLNICRSSWKQYN